jgi:hypothetical protein
MQGTNGKPSIRSSVSSRSRRVPARSNSTHERNTASAAQRRSTTTFEGISPTSDSNKGKKSNKARGQTPNSAANPAADVANDAAVEQAATMGETMVAGKTFVNKTGVVTKKRPAPSAQIKRKLVQTVDVGIKCACVVRRYDEIWAAQRDGTILIFRASTGERTHTIDNGEHMCLVWCMALVKRHVWAVRASLSCIFPLVCLLPLACCVFRACTFAMDRTYAHAHTHTQGTETGKVLIFNAFTHELEREVKEHGGGVTCMVSNSMGNVEPRPRCRQIADSHMCSC